MFKAGDRVQNGFTRLIARVVSAQQSRPDVPSGFYKFTVRFEDKAAAERHYAHGDNGLYAFTRVGVWAKIDDAPAPMDDTRDYLDALISFRA